MKRNYKRMSTLKVGETATVQCIAENAALRRRLRELGLCDGAKVTCTFQGAHRDIAVYKICGAQIAVRDCDAQHVWVLAEVAE
ncbi:MAG: ferrous iron transport protein A [Ruminococcus sp.]|nr:ferrous iron transport protein A [Ruminococcus sp.]